MASADLGKELECSICLDYYKDPVILECGHNYCRDCIGRVLDIQEESGGYSCPECKQMFGRRPALQRNLKLRNIVENFLSTQPDEEYTGVSCTYCIHTPVPAVKSCLHCEASLCDNHLKVHSKSPEHVLCDPTTSLEDRKCSVHKKILEYYCTEDSACICVSCSLAGEHRGHQVETLDEASDMRKKKLRNVLQRLMTETEETERRVQSLQERRRKVQGKAAKEMQRVTALFRDLRRRLEDLEKRVLSEISGQAERISLSLSDIIQQLEIKKDELSRKMRHIEELCNMTDPLTVLQESHTGDLCDTEDGDDEVRERHDRLLHDGGDLDVAGISLTLHTGLSDIMSGKTLGVSGVTDILLDVKTACNNLHISDDRKTVSRSLYQNRPQTPERFQCDQVISCQSFFSGRHYWEVDVGESMCWSVGMCYPSIDRRGDQSEIGSMASADLGKELECSVCLDYYTDPVILECGHNFCRDCIGRVLDTQERSGGYSCPECKQRFVRRPALQRNLKLRNIAETFLSAQPDEEYTGVSCTYCIHTPVPAVKSCLMCEASLCDNHLKVHSKSPEHVFCDPTTSLEDRKCSVHKKILEYYCTEDSACICVSCRLDGEHRGHQVETLDEASDMRKKKLRNVVQRLRTETEETERRVQSLQERRRKVQGKAAEETQRVTALFRDLRRRLEDLEKRVLSEISGQAERISLSLSDIIQQLEIKKDELSRKMRHIEGLCNMTDPLTVLQESHTGDLCDTEDGDDEDRERHDKLLHDGGDLDVAMISLTLHTGLSDIPGGPNIGAVQKTLGVSGVTDILLDVSTACNYLHISDDRKTVSSSDSQNRPETPERFEYPQVISCQRFSSGRHYWEVEVGESEDWTVGMCYPSIDRRGNKSAIEWNKKSWCLEWWRGNQYSVTHNKKKIRLPCDVSSNRVRIDLNYEAGRISFYELCDPIQHLHTFTTTFTEPLHAALGVVGGRIKITRGNQM
ncbi:E3 ubiquitin/ISG15 ligase TRIM25-like [Mantella aurantiaca]